MSPNYDTLRDLPLQEIAVPRRSLSRFEPVIGPERYGQLQDAAALASQQLAGTTVWNVSSTAAGGGVAEMLQVLVGYILDVEVAIRWMVMNGDSEFFAITKRIHNRLHGIAGDRGELGPAEAAHYSDVTTANAASAIRRIRRGDVVLLHDPQSAGMAQGLADAGARVVWRCHVGRDTANEWTEQAWSFLRPHLSACSAFIFSLASYAPSWVDDHKVWVIPPSIDPFSPKNQEMPEKQVLRAVGRIGLLPASEEHTPAEFTRSDGTAGLVQRGASYLSPGSALEPGVPLVAQVSRWDRLKDMAGVMSGFAEYVPARVEAHLALVGPSTAEVADDPEGAEVFAECVAAWEALPDSSRRRVTLVTLPMEDIDENAAMVNAIQRHAAVIVQKSLEEGFGLTVAEGMWKAKAVLASNVGGIAEQIAPGTGLLLDDPTDLRTFGEILATLLERPREIAELGARARQHVLEGFVGDSHLLRYAHLISWLLAQ
ncbi:MAG: glycosyltransferase [Acidimicrobiales bacterium]